MPRTRACIALIALGLAVGCQDRPAGWLPNSEPSLKKTPAEFAATAKAVFPYPADAPRGGDLPARAEIGYDLNVIHFVNYSKETWTNAELWVNRRFVIKLDKVEPNKAFRIGFKLLYNENGQSFPENGAFVETLELKKDGSLFDVPKGIGG